MLLVVFSENHGFLNFLTKSNLFKGLFCRKCQKVTFWSLFGHLLVTFCQEVTGLGWFNEGYVQLFSVPEKCVFMSPFRRFSK